MMDTTLKVGDVVFLRAGRSPNADRVLIYRGLKDPDWVPYPERVKSREPMPDWCIGRLWFEPTVAGGHWLHIPLGKKRRPRHLVQLALKRVIDPKTGAEKSWEELEIYA